MIGRLFTRMLPGAAVVVAAAGATVLTLRTLARLSAERTWARAWAAYQRERT